MNYPREFFTGFIFLIIAACDTQVQTPPVKKHTEIIPVPIEEHAIVDTVPQGAKPVLNLSIDNISGENVIDNDDLFFSDNVRVDESSDLFKVISKKPPESSIYLSGELLTDENADDETDFLESVDGIQIEIQGSFN